MASVTFDKKQLPQVVVLGVLTLGLFGFFASKLFVSPATQASSAPPPPASSLQTGGTGSVGGNAGSPAGASTTVDPNAAPDPSTLIGAGAPTDSMRDPFVPVSPLTTLAAVELPTAPRVASNTASSLGSIPGLGQIKPLPMPNSGGLPSLSSAGVPSEPNGQPGADQNNASWQVTGIIQSDTDPSNALAILRDTGGSRRYLRLGDQLDGNTRLVGIDKNSITMVRSGQRFQLNVSSTITELDGAANSTPQAPKPAQGSLLIPTPEPISQPITAPAVIAPVHVPQPVYYVPGVHVPQPVYHAPPVHEDQSASHAQSKTTSSQSFSHGAAD